ncbi:respiratory nitrate reductase subunit gamma [Nocardia niigatensis]|uniref:respiratory nitrate reductase subunit gamma n=1 Tax=Nocardia niigatensis TaxID=209249 RepID=UPI0002FB232F|nr:respiratory nitrate reductase subunit gamma [Nocardia niigatensis]
MTLWDVGMMIALWVALPYAALVSCVAGHVWRYRRDGFRGYLYGPHLDRAQRAGIAAVRTGFPIVFVVRVVEMVASGPHSRPDHGIQLMLAAIQIVAVPVTITGVALILIPPLISADVRHRVTPVDRLTLPLLAAALLSAVLVTFDGGSTDSRYRTAETLFTWARSVIALHPESAVMDHAPLLYQVRGLIVVLIIAVWPYTRLAGILIVPLLRVARQVAAVPYRSAPTV